MELMALGFWELAWIGFAVGFGYQMLKLIVGVVIGVLALIFR